tara:strand:+ start:5643 stop:7424 length:1782 start_codon:yes stop_codon:yes gene_type:complete
MSYQVGIKYFNSFWLKKVLSKAAAATNIPSWPGLPWYGFGNTAGYPSYPFGSNTASTRSYLDNNYQNYYIEESRIKGGFNNAQLSLGVRAYVINNNRDSTDRKHSLIYSGLLNTRTGFNDTNVFSIADPLVRDLDPLNGSIQKLYAEDTNLTVFQENKVSKILINKNAIYSGDQGSLETGAEVNVLGQDVPYLGEYGISRNPESFAVYGYRKYFADKDRAAILRLSRDGITEISGYGMRDYFRDNLALIPDTYDRQVVTAVIDTSATPTGTGTDIYFTTSINNKVEIGAIVEVVTSGGITTNTGSLVVGIESATRVKISPAFNLGTPISYQNINFVTYRRGRAIGAWDAHQSAYTISLQNKPRTIATPITPLNSTDGNFDTLGYDEQIKGWTSFYSYKPDFIGSLKNNFFSFIDSNIYQHYDESVSDGRGKFYGATTPAESFVEFIFNPNPTVVKNFNTIAYEGNNGWEVDSYVSDFEGFDQVKNTGVFNQYQDTTNSVKSYVEGQYDNAGNVYPATLTEPIFRAGFDRKENHYVANLVNSSVARPGEIIFGNSVSGVKGYLITVKMSIDSSTDVGGAKQLFSASSNFVISSI